MRKHLVTSVLAIVALAAVAIPSSAKADGGGGHARRVRLQDNCDPATFNAQFGAGTCVPFEGHGNANQRTTLPEFFAALNPVTHVGHPKWNNKPDELDLREGDSIKVVVRGGEYHTFTKVSAFGPGCIGPLNDALGLTGIAGSGFDCAQLFTTDSGVHPGGSITVGPDILTTGTLMFMCEIHPWMQTVVHVEAADDQDDD